MSAPLPYFGYGSNLWLEQMQHRCRHSSVIGIGKINGWKWIINSRGYATIVQSEGDFVYGMIFEMTRGDYKLLDAFEGSTYEKTEIRDSTGRVCLTYIDRNAILGFPDTKYIFRLYRGLGDGVMKGIPPEYFAKYVHPFLTRPSSATGSAALDDRGQPIFIIED